MAPRAASAEFQDVSNSATVAVQGREEASASPPPTATGGTSPAQEGSVSAEGLTCAICLDCINPADLALIPKCEHQYCATCILHWAMHKEACWCPQCRVPFTQLLTYRTLDGSMRDFPVSESLCLLKRATWFQEYVTAREKGKSPAPSGSDAYIPPEVMDWQDYGRYFDEYDDDEEVENYYFSSAAGRARITLGNRRWGENGYVSSGRMHARPVAPVHPAKGGKAGKGSPAAAAGKAGKTAANSCASPAAGPATPAQQAGRPCGCSAAPGACAPQTKSTHTPARRASGSVPVPGSDESPAGSGGSRSGRRARRNARKAAADARGGGLDSD